MTALLFSLLSGCADWPDVNTPRPTRASVDWPELVPIAALPTATQASSEDAATDQLLARAEALRNRAGILRGAVPDSDAFERMRSRLAR